MMNTSLTIAVASGKGGTGKTTIATNLAFALCQSEQVQLLDCDVEEPNDHLFLHPSFTQREDVAIAVPMIDKSRCIVCGRCRDFCMFNAITRIGDQMMAFPELCHGCGGCRFICPSHAITEGQRVIGAIEMGTVQQMAFAHGRSKVGNALTPPIIRRVKEKIAKERVTILDAPPGTSCPVVTTLDGADFVILVTEPTPFGLHDLRLAVEVVRKMEIPFGVVINRADLGNAGVESYCQQEAIPILLTIGFKREYAATYAKGLLIAEKDPTLARELREMFHAIQRRVGE